MHLEDLIEFCLTLPSSETTMPFDEYTLVFKVGGKVFCLCSLNNFISINIKHPAEEIVELTEKYQAVSPGYHMNKKHWVTIMVNQDVSDKKLYALIHQSYALVFSKLNKKTQNEIAG
jgi:predicted DNA-binding protein (MmcQ/YjbR family)